LGSISWVRVIVGGLVAGFVINLSEFLLNGNLLAKRWEAAMATLGKPPIAGASIGIFVTLGFLLGIGALFLYSLIRTRLGAGPQTAVTAGLLVWFFAVFYANLVLIGLGVFPATLPLFEIVWRLFEIPIATVFGAFLYGEPAGR
jgi:hypothetical protein